MAYKQMAYVYDKLMEDAPYDKWIEFTESMLEGNHVERIVDLGCGTGEITVRLAGKGFQMIGVDNSSDMLTYANNKATENKQNITWLHQDIRELEGLSNLDAAISYCDVINYVTEEADLKEVFKRTFSSLKSGGLFLFDIHSLHQVENNYHNQTFADVLDDVSYIWFCTEGDEKGEMYHDLTFFVSDGQKYNRFDEIHHQRTYSITFYSNLLLKAGFSNIKVYADFSVIDNNIEENSERIFFVAEKARDH
ncbi:class I SAM-dependent DNA methyltransferase [Oceanobacillus halophilus]|uniref:Class I SAM-dependent methyltransferase n=1 Tax=Oceanobacillus halophilus TaxID=930130 RepID=A0A495AD37_9BACI|nr:class I SAM-dependent methyltransferase [Oceanobacillus halophilus]RKQ37848.1 class I SAM-dependent methyltransferase [Oceanobacillus halophilus]